LLCELQQAARILLDRSLSAKLKPFVLVGTLHKTLILSLAISSTNTDITVFCPNKHVSWPGTSWAGVSASTLPELFRAVAANSHQVPGQV
jgi:hypothetical protein